MSTHTATTPVVAALRTLLRPLTNSLIILVAIGFGLIILNANAYPLENGFSGIARALSLFYTVGPALAGVAAWDMSRFQKLLEQRGSAHDLWHIIVRRLTAPTLFGFMSVLVLMGSYGGLSTSQSWVGVLLSVVPVVLWTLFGVAVALYLPLVVALPLAVFIPWVLIGYPAASADMAWRQMFGQPDAGCCMVDMQIDTVTIRASLMTLSLLFLSCLLLVSLKYTRKAFRIGGVVGSALIMIAAIASGYSLGKDGNSMDAMPRSSSDRICDERICLWPESDQAMSNLNLDVAEKLGIPDGLLLVDGEPRASNELRMYQNVDPRAVEQHLLLQLLSRDPTLRSIDSCWVDEFNDPLSMADLANALTYRDDLIDVATDSHGRFLGYSLLQNNAAPDRWTPLIDLINGEIGCNK